MKTELTIAQQKQFLSDNWQANTLRHVWSSRGYGNSKILDDQDNVIAKASGFGYDRRGTVIGQMIEVYFQDSLNKLAKRECKGTRRTRKTSSKFYGLFYDAVNQRAYVDGGCGESCMKKILNKIGFTLEYVGEHEKSNNGVQFYKLVPITKHERKYF